MAKFIRGQSGNPNGRPVERNFINKRDAFLFYRFGIRLSDYEKILSEQGGVCAICGNPETKAQSRNGKKQTDPLVVDHDHETGEVRGLLCYRCNTGIGKLYDSHVIIENALRYLKRHLTKRALDVCPVCAGKGFVKNSHGVEQFCIPCDGTGQRQ